MSKQSVFLKGRSLGGDKEIQQQSRGSSFKLVLQQGTVCWSLPKETSNMWFQLQKKTPSFKICDVWMLWGGFYGHPSAEGLPDAPIRGYRDAKWTSSSTDIRTHAPNSLWLRWVTVRIHQGAQPHLIYCKTIPCQDGLRRIIFTRGKMKRTQERQWVSHEQLPPPVKKTTRKKTTWKIISMCWDESCY